MLTNSQNGFALVQALIVAALMGVLSLIFGSMINSQNQSVNYVEDRLAAVQMAGTVETILRSPQACEKSFSGLSIQKNNNTAVTSIKDTRGKVLVKSNTKEQHLRVGQMTLSAPSPLGASSSGIVALSIPLQRLRKGGGPEHLSALKVQVLVSLNSHGKITKCSADDLDEDNTVTEDDEETASRGDVHILAQGHGCNSSPGAPELLAEAKTGIERACNKQSYPMKSKMKTSDIKGIETETSSTTISANNGRGKYKSAAECKGQYVYSLGDIYTFTSGGNYGSASRTMKRICIHGRWLTYETTTRAGSD